MFRSKFFAPFFAPFLVAFSVTLSATFVTLLLSVLVSAPVAALDNTARTTHKLTIAAQKIDAEIVASPSDRQQGLMFRQSMPVNHGMLFVFEEAQLHCFWMKNTPLPLSIGFFNAKGELINVLDMTPLSEASNCPSKPAKYALEMNQGWFAKHKIKAGSKLEGIPAKYK